MRTPSLILSALLVLASSSRVAGADDPAGGYRVAFIRASAGGDPHWSTPVVAVGKDVLVGSPGEISFADVYDARTGKQKRYFPGGPDTGSFGRAVGESSRGYLIGDTLVNEAYLFSKASGRLLRTFRPPVDVRSLDFGYAVAEVGSTIVVGDPMAGQGDAGIHGQPGLAYLFDRASGALGRTVTSPSPRGNGAFGGAITRCEGGFAVGEPATFTFLPGAVHIFDRDGTWRQTLQAPTPVPRDRFGAAVAAYGSRLLVGAPSTFDQASAAYLYERHHGTFVLARTQPTVGAFRNIGSSVALARDRALIGAHNAVMLFDLPKARLRATLEPPIADFYAAWEKYLPWEGFGFSAALVGDVIVVGTDGDQENAGSIVVGFAPNAPPPPECATTYPCP